MAEEGETKKGKKGAVVPKVEEVRWSVDFFLGRLHSIPAAQGFVRAGLCFSASSFRAIVLVMLTLL